MNQIGDSAGVNPFMHRIVVHCLGVALRGSQHQCGAGPARVMQPKQPKALLAVVVDTGDKGVLAGTDLPHYRQV